VRIPKDGGERQIIARSEKNIYAVDVDGPRVYFGTARLDFRPFAFDDELRVVSLFGEPALLAEHTGWIPWIGHDEARVYFLELTDSGYFRMRALDKRSGAITTLAETLEMHINHISIAVGEQALYVGGFYNLMVIDKSGGVRAAPRSTADVFTHGGAIYASERSPFTYYGPYRLTEDNDRSAVLPLPGYAPTMYALSGDLLYYAAIPIGPLVPPVSRVRHICSGMDEEIDAALPRAYAVLADSCAVYRVADDGNVTRLPGGGDFRIDAVTPTHAKPGERITLHGSGFDRADTLTFNGADLLAVTIDKHEITTVVPEVKAGDLVNVVGVHDPDGRCTGTYFTVDR
jgi:hypothetical protein